MKRISFVTNIGAAIAGGLIGSIVAAPSVAAKPEPRSGTPLQGLPLVCQCASRMPDKVLTTNWGRITFDIHGGARPASGTLAKQCAICGGLTDLIRR